MYDRSPRTGPLALKLLRVRAEDDAGWREVQPRLLREARALAQLSPPNVVTIYDVGALSHGVFIATELVDGCTVRQWLGQRPRGWREIVDVFLAAGEGLAAAHAVGIVHRDFKPDNVLVGADDRVRVADFGMARMFVTEEPSAVTAGDPDALAVTGALLGTPAYMAPEQLDGRQVDARSDQFSFSSTSCTMSSSAGPPRRDRAAAATLTRTKRSVNATIARRSPWTHAHAR